MKIQTHKIPSLIKPVYLIIIVLITILASSCSSTKITHLTEIPVEINKKGTYKTTFSIYNSTYIIPYIVIEDNQGENRDWGNPIKDTLLHISLKLINSDGEIVFSQEFNNKNIRESNLCMPNTTLSFDMDFKKRIKNNNVKFEAILEIIQPTEYYGKYPTKFVIDPPEKFK